VGKNPLYYVLMYFSDKDMKEENVPRNLVVVVIQNNKVRRNKNMEKHMIIKMILLVLFLFVGSMSAFGQDAQIKCEVSGSDPNLWGAPGYKIKFGSFVVSKEVGEEAVVKSYKVPETKLILNVFVAYSPYKYGPSGEILGVRMILGRKRISPFSDFYDEKMAKDIASAVEVEYPISGFDKGGEGKLSMPIYSGKKKTIRIFMKCKKVKKEGK